MKINATNKYSFGFAPLMIAAMIFGGVQYCQKHKVMKANVTLNSELIAAQNAPIKVRDSIHDSIIYRDRWHTPKSVTIPSIIHDTFFTEKPKWCQEYFSDTATLSVGKLHAWVKYAIRVKDCEVQVQFPEFNLPIDYRIETRTVLKTINRANFDWGLLAGISINSLRSTPAPQLGLYLRDKKVTIGGSLLFNPADKLPYGQIIFGYSLKK